jgi:hypothetical protein
MEAACWHRFQLFVHCESVCGFHVESSGRKLARGPLHSRLPSCVRATTCARMTSVNMLLHQQMCVSAPNGAQIADKPKQLVTRTEWKVTSPQSPCFRLSVTTLILVRMPV